MNARPAGDDELRTKSGEASALHRRTKEFALQIIKLYSSLPKMTEVQVFGKQLLMSGTSVGAHYREATRARSRPEFISKIQAGLQELEETIYWLELLEESFTDLVRSLITLSGEANQLMAMLTASVKTARSRSTLIIHGFAHRYGPSTIYHS